MCGILGAFPSTAINPEFIRHRGPDGFGQMEIDGLAMAHTRLKILDLSGRAAQPKWSQNGNVLLAYNGEIYNYSRLSPDNGSDTVALADWLSHQGPRFTAERLDGMYAFAAYFVREKRLILCRDPAGIKPLYVYLKPDGSFLAFSSEIKGFFGLPGFNPVPNPDKQVAVDFLQYGYAFDRLFNRSIFRWNLDLPLIPTLIADVFQLLPGAKLSISLHTRPEYVRNSILPGHSRQSIPAVLSASVKAQSVSDVPVGVQLSGGIDSSLVAYYHTRTHTSTHGFYISIDDPAQNEDNRLPFILRKLRSGGRTFKFHSLKFTYNDFLSHMEKAVWYMDEPLIRHPNAIAIFHLCEYVKSHTPVKVLLTGEGADEIFGGYSWQDGVTTTDYDTSRRIFDLGGDPRVREFFASSPGSNSILRSQLIFDRNYYLPPLLARQDRMSMAHSLESRVPFLSAEFLQFKPPEKPGKTGLKRLSQKIFGAQFSNFPKQGFGLPETWIGSLPYSAKSLRWLNISVTPRTDFQRWALYSLSKWSDYYLHEGWKNVV